ncbi:MAG: DUF2970 domain-containing protein [Gammaproteobacteria bacterium]|nr:DUF2970 domain-containing protein [Gammaproteobacteria bacterium]
MDQEKKPAQESMTFGALLLSVLAAFFGVQSNANRERDFSKGKLSHFIVIGLLLALVFILIVVGVVSLVMHLAGT